MTHHGNVTKINGAGVEPVDVITFGSPCQDLSVAGKRAGIQDGERSNLFFEAVRIIKEMREATNGEYPKYAVWENVPGAFSSNKGDDFHAVLEALCSVCDSTVSIPKPCDKRKHSHLLHLLPELGQLSVVDDSGQHGSHPAPLAQHLTQGSVLSEQMDG